MTIIIKAPLANAQVSGTIAVSGTIDTTLLPNGLHTISMSDGTNYGSVSVSVLNAAALSVSSPLPNAAAPTTFNIIGKSLASNVAAFDHATGTKIGADVTPSGGAFSIPVNMAALTGTRQIDVTAFSVPAGQSGGTQATVSVSVNIAIVPPVVVKPAMAFYGINGHYVQGGLSVSVPLAAQAASLADLGVKIFRQDCYNNSHIDTFVSTIIPGLGKGVQVLPVLIAHPWNDPSISGTPTETSAYNYAFAMAAYAATKLAGIPAIEFGNEYDIDSHNAGIKNDGVNVTDYDNSTWPIWRGALRGSLDGWRSVDTARVTKLIATATSGYIHFGWTDGMLNGTAPDGSTGHPKVTTDWIQWHYYQDGGDMTAVAGKTGTYNVLAEIQKRNNLPIRFTELGSSPDQSAASQVAYITNTWAKLGALRTQYNIVGIDFYELFNYPNDAFGVMLSGTVQQPNYQPLKTAIKDNP
jgi:hypothetical protein